MDRSIRIPDPTGNNLAAHCRRTVTMRSRLRERMLKVLPSRANSEYTTMRIEEIVRKNESTRQALVELVSTLSEDSYRCPLSLHWTVASTLCHLCFWDQRALFLLKSWASGGTIEIPRLDAASVNSINQAVNHIALEVPGSAAGRIAVESATAVDPFVAQIGDELAQRIEAAGFERYLQRSLHRQEHLDKIRQALNTKNRKQ